MKKKLLIYIYHLLLWGCLLLQNASAQRYLSEFDSALLIKDTLRPLSIRLSNLYFSGYMQPQFQVAESKGELSYGGGNFAENSNNRFMLRRARLKVDYLVPAKNQSLPMAIFTFQFDATERGVIVRDMFLKLNDPKGKKVSMILGLMARPFGFEVNLSSSYRETPERARMSQILMPGERDLGVMFSYESKPSTTKKPLFKYDVGVYNGPGLSATTDFDSYKDIISRLTLKPFAISDNFSIGSGLSLLYGGWMQGTKYRYEMQNGNASKGFILDSSSSNYGTQVPRHYYGADLQLAYKHDWGKTELRGEYWRGTQPGVALSTANPGAIPTTPTYIRPFDGLILYFLQNIINKEWELMVKYDWYDPNRKISGRQIGGAATNFTSADIKYTTIGIGLTHYFNSNLKMLGYYDIVSNENTNLTGYKSNIPDNVFTLRMQLRF
jgi:hypothetical protein